MKPTIIWDLEDDTEGNWWRIVVEGHGITAEEVEEVLRDYHTEGNAQPLKRPTDYVRMDGGRSLHRRGVRVSFG